MKVFTVGMDEKPPIKDTPAAPDGVSLAPTPVITFEKKRSSYKSYMMCLGTLFFILLFAIIISELAYNRARDESYLRLRWAELKHRMGMGCDDCMGARIAQAFYPQRFQGAPVVLESSNDAAVPAMRMQQVQTTEQPTSTTSASQSSDESAILPQVMDSRLDFLRKVIPKIKEQAEKSGIEGVMQVKVLQIDPVDVKPPVSFLDGFGEIQPQPAVNVPQPGDFMAPSRPIFAGPLADLLRWNAVDNDDRLPGNAFMGRQSDMMLGEPVLIMGPFLQPQQQSWPGAWDNNNAAWNNAQQGRPSGWTQQSLRQQQLSSWQWPYNNNNNNNQNAALWSSNQQPIPVVQQQQQQQNPATTWQTGNQWQNGVQAGGSWQNGIQTESGNQWPQNAAGWQQQWSQYPQTWPASQNQNQKSSDWSLQRVTESSSAAGIDNIKKLIAVILANRLTHLFQQKFLQQQQQANIADNLDGRMSQAVLPAENINNNNYNYNSASDQWMRYYSQWYANNQRMQHQQPIATTAVKQSLEVTEPRAPGQAQDESALKQLQVVDSQQSQFAAEKQIQGQQQQQPQTIQHFPDQSMQSQISAETGADAVPNVPFQQTPIIPVVNSGTDQNVPQAAAPFVFDNVAWKKSEEPSVSPVVPIIDGEQQQQKPQQEQEQQPQLPIRSVEGGSSGVGVDVKLTDGGPLKDLERSFQQSGGPVNDAVNVPSNPILFQVDEPPQHSVSMEEGFAK